MTIMAGWSRAQGEHDWAMVQNNLGLAFQEQAERLGNVELLQQAEVAYRAALAVFTPEKSPADWANTQDRLGWLLGRLGEVTEEPELVRQGRNSVAEVWATYKAAGNSQFDTYFGDRLKVFDKTLADLH